MASQITGMDPRLTVCSGIHGKKCQAPRFWSFVMGSHRPRYHKLMVPMQVWRSDHKQPTKKPVQGPQGSHTGSAWCATSMRDFTNLGFVTHCGPATLSHGDRTWPVWVIDYACTVIRKLLRVHTCTARVPYGSFGGTVGGLSIWWYHMT